MLDNAISEETRNSDCNVGNEGNTKIKASKLCWLMYTYKSKAGLEWPRGFQEVKVPRLQENGTGWW
jgi:hypothetical protein